VLFILYIVNNNGVIIIFTCPCLARLLFIADSLPLSIPGIFAQTIQFLLLLLPIF